MAVPRLFQIRSHTPRQSFSSLTMGRSSPPPPSGYTNLLLFSPAFLFTIMFCGFSSTIFLLLFCSSGRYYCPCSIWFWLSDASVYYLSLIYNENLFPIYGVALQWYLCHTLAYMPYLYLAKKKEFPNIASYPLVLRVSHFTLSDS